MEVQGLGLIDVGGREGTYQAKLMATFVLICVVPMMVFLRPISSRQLAGTRSFQLRM